jgi:hypothetical protein
MSRPGDARPPVSGADFNGFGLKPWGPAPGQTGGHRRPPRARSHGSASARRTWRHAHEGVEGLIEAAHTLEPHLQRRLGHVEPSLPEQRRRPLDTVGLQVLDP